MKLSVILSAYDMAREIPRTLQGLARDYQHGAADLEYEVLLVDNASPEPLDASTWAHLDVPVRLMRLEHASASPVHGINRAIDEARGELVALMIDGAHILTPGVFRFAFAAFAMHRNAVVATRYFWLGPGEQNTSVRQGYSKAVEDDLLSSINWPERGYRLFEIGEPLHVGADPITWTGRMFESNCLILRRDLLRELGGLDDRFDQPGGGVVNMDIFKRAVDAPGTTPVQLIGEGSFHQLHGGTTTNVTPGERDKRIEEFMQRYESIRGDRDIISKKPFLFLGHLPNQAAKIHRDRGRSA